MAKLVFLSLVVLTLVSCAVFVPAARESTEELVYYDASASKVQLIADWNNWGGLTGDIQFIDPSCSVMEEEDGVWVISIPENLRRGRYRYAFLVNGLRIEHDPLNPVTDMFGQNEVSVLVID